MTEPQDVSADLALTTTRAVRRRIDSTRDVPREVIRECLEIALQAPTGSNRQNWHFVVVTDPARRAALGDVYSRAMKAAGQQVSPLTRIDPTDRSGYEAQTERVMRSASWMFDRLGEMPGLLIPCVSGRIEDAPASARASFYGSILPATWSFMLAARARGIGTTWTTAHLALEAEAAQVLGIPYADVTQVAMIPFGYVTGDPFKPAMREPLESVTHWDRW